MYRISQLAARLGLSRTTLLYYEKLGLIRGRRRANGYRDYSEEDFQRLQLVKALQSGGLTLNECKTFFSKGMDRELLRQRLGEITDEIEEKQQAKQLLEALLGERKDHLRSFHERLDLVAPKAHADWLRREGFTDDDIYRLRWLSHDYTQHEAYMRDFLTIFEPLDTHGPASEEDTLAALDLVPIEPTSILDMASGPGNATLLLAKHTQAHVHALDNLDQSLERLANRAIEESLESRIDTVNGSMDAPPFEERTFDLIWCENSAYVIGFERALTIWKALLRLDGVSVISDLVWLNDNPKSDVKAYWQAEYPDMSSLRQRKQQVDALAYDLIGTHTISDAAWANYCEPLAQRLDEIRDQMPGSEALAALDREMPMLKRQVDGDFGYVFFVLKPRL